MSDLTNDNSDLGEQGSDTINQPGVELAELQAKLSASSNEGKLMNEVSKVLVSDDFKYFSELSSKDSKTAERVIEKIAKLKGMDTEEVRNLLMVNDNSDKSLTPYEIERKVKETIEKQAGEKALETFINEIGLHKNKELNEEFMSNFEDYMQGKEFTVANVKKFSKSAYRDINEDKVKAFEKKKGDIEAQIVSGSKSKDTKVETQGRQLLTATALKDW